MASSVNTHGRIWRSQQAVVNGATWFSLVPFAVSPPGGPVSREMLGSELTLARDGGGRLDVIVASSHGVLHRLQTTPGVAS